jgi:hypothetical protein
MLSICGQAASQEPGVVIPKSLRAEKKDPRRRKREAWTKNRTPHKTKDFLSPQDPCQRKVCCKLGFASRENCINNGHYKL